jgi:ABC-type enterochelin transport system permease subunit
MKTDLSEAGTSARDVKKSPYNRPNTPNQTTNVPSANQPGKMERLAFVLSVLEALAFSSLFLLFLLGNDFQRSAMFLLIATIVARSVIAAIQSFIALKAK